jgi:hypothetical protein
MCVDKALLNEDDEVAGDLDDMVDVIFTDTLEQKFICVLHLSLSDLKMSTIE